MVQLIKGNSFLDIKIVKQMNTFRSQTSYGKIIFLKLLQDEWCWWGRHAFAGISWYKWSPKPTSSAVQYPARPCTAHLQMWNKKYRNTGEERLIQNQLIPMESLASPAAVCRTMYSVHYHTTMLENPKHSIIIHKCWKYDIWPPKMSPILMVSSLLTLCTA